MSGEMLLQWETCPFPDSWAPSESELVGRAAFRSASEALVDFAGLHHENDAASGGDVAKRVAVHGDDVRVHPWRDGADFVLEAQRGGGDASSRHDRGHGILAAIANANDEFFRVASVRAGDSVSAVNN